MSQNVMVPLSLFERIIDFFQDDLNPIPKTHPVGYERDDILWELNEKKKKLELRDAYAKIIHADNQYDRDDARIEYLKQKRLLNDEHSNC